MSMNYSTEQADAIDLCCEETERIVCVTGAAGTGKTTILKGAAERLEEQFPSFGERSSVVLAAPTGRAAKRIQEATGIPAMTIHRMLRFTTPESDDDITLPRHTKRNPLPYDVILIDEASMIDTELYRGLIDAMHRNAIIRFFGDINQLPPVASTTSPFNEAMKRFPTATLTHNYRSEDGIIEMSDRIIKGRIPTANSQVAIYKLKYNETFYKLRDICEEIDFTRMDNQIIAPTNMTKYGCDPINKFMQQRYNDEKEKIQTFQKDSRTGDMTIRSFKRGDKVIWTKNNYDLAIMNGTLGVVQGFDAEEGTISCTFDDRDVLIPPSIETFNPTTGQRYRYDPRNQMMLGYAITTHKSQGSQFDTVVYVLSPSRAATRQNLYTAATRAKKNLIVLGVARALMSALNTKAST